MILSDKDLLNGIRNGDRETIGYVYKTFFPVVQGIISSLHGSKEDAHDIFQESLMIVYSKLLNEQLNLTCSLKTYLCTIARNLGTVAMRQKSTFSFSAVDDDFLNISSLIEEPVLLPEEEEKRLLYEKHFNLITNECQKLLKYCMLELSIKRITVLMHFKSDDYTKVRKNKCKEYLMKSIFSDPTYKELTYESYRNDRAIPRW
jgi:DNA-directed RNA polymerase specialized sigma24 family protein